MDPSSINWLATLAATVSAFILGGLWYSPAVFGTAWMRETGLSEEQLRARSMVKVFGLAFLWTLVMAVNLALFLAGPETTVSWGAAAGCMAGFGWAAMGLFVVGLFEARSWRLMLINAGYLTTALTLMGAILGAWR